MPVVKEKELTSDDPNYGKFPEGIKTYYNYNVIDKSLLGIWETYGYWNNIYSRPKEARVYDKNGLFINNIKPTHNVKLSTNENYFVSYPIDEIGKDTIFIYDFKGNIFPCIFIESFDPRIGFSRNSEYIKIYDYSIQKFYVADFVGNIVFTDYIDSGILFDFFVSPDCSQILTSVFYPNNTTEAFLLNKNNKVIWEKPIKRVNDCNFFEDGNILLSVLGKIGKRIILLNTKGGQLGTNECDDVFQFGKSYFIIKNGGKHYEYKVI